jgi:hypothetical protein
VTLHHTSEYRLLQTVGILLGLTLMGCGVSSPIRTLPEGQLLLNASVGGAAAPGLVPTTIVPYSRIGYMYGVDSSVTIGGGVHPTMAMLSVLGVDAMAAARVIRQHDVVPELTASAELIVFQQLRGNYEQAMLVQPTFSASWDVSTTLVFVSARATWQPASGTTLLTPSVGAEIPLSRNINIHAEALWYAANATTSYGALQGKSSIGGYGAAGVMLGVLWKVSTE